MPLKERITNVDMLRSWKGEIPLRYEYTAGVAGERFLRGLREGRILASRCSNCRKMFIPPKAYCVECFVEIRDYREVGPAAVVGGLTESHVDFEGKRIKAPRTLAFLIFGGVTGGLVHRAGGKGLAIGSIVEPRFRAARKRTGSLLDIEEFVTVALRGSPGSATSSSA